MGARVKKFSDTRRVVEIDKILFVGVDTIAQVIKSISEVPYLTNQGKMLEIKFRVFLN